MNKSSDYFCHETDIILASIPSHFHNKTHKIVDDILGAKNDIKALVYQSRKILTVLSDNNVKAKRSKFMYGRQVD